MTAYPGTAYRYFAIDSDHDLSTSILKISTDKTLINQTATYIPAPNARLQAVTPPPAAGLTRYWWGFLCGTGQPVALASGPNLIYGQLTDNPESLPFVWKFYLPHI